MVSGIKRQVGLFLILTGLIHTVFGLVVYSGQLEPIIADGLWNTVAEGQWDRATGFWFLMFGFLLMLVGYIANWLMKKKGIAPPASFGWMLFAICLAGVIVMPASGFWLGLPQAWMLLRK